jgi:hypothetical protein
MIPVSQPRRDERPGTQTGTFITLTLASRSEAVTWSANSLGVLTLASFAYLRLPLAIAGVAFVVGAVATWRWRGIVTQLGLGVMTILFLNAARIAGATFDPYLSSQASAGRAAIGADLAREALSSGAYLGTTSQFPERDQIEKPPACAEGFSFTARVSLPADLNTAWGYAATTGSSALSHPAAVRDNLHPKGTFPFVVRIVGGAAQCGQAGLCRARRCGVVSR